MDIYSQRKFNKNNINQPEYICGISFNVMHCINEQCIVLILLDQKDKNILHFRDEEISDLSCLLLNVNYQEFNIEYLNDIVNSVNRNNLPINIISFRDSCNNCIEYANILSENNYNVNSISIVCNCNPYSKNLKYVIPIMILENDINKIGLQNFIKNLKNNMKATYNISINNSNMNSAKNKIIEFLKK